MGIVGFWQYDINHFCSVTQNMLSLLLTVQGPEQSHIIDIIFRSLLL